MKYRIQQKQNLCIGIILKDVKSNGQNSSFRESDESNDEI